MRSKRLEKPEALRGFAALYVVLFHVLPQKIMLGGINIGLLFRFGPEAVIVFFAISGFVIKYTFEQSPDQPFRAYLYRRMIRLYIPLLFVYLLGYALKCYAEGALVSPEWDSLVKNLLMLQDVTSQKPNVITGAYMGNGVLWSLSYEWWFYMLFYLLRRKIPAARIQQWVAIITITAALTYLVYPFTLNRFVMYFAIWWTGVHFAELYLTHSPVTFRSVRPQSLILLTVTLLLGINLWLHFSSTRLYSYPLVAYPFVELRHFMFAVIMLYASVIWNNLKWLGYKQLFGVFKYLAPGSYLIYISHHYLVVQATYLRFLQNKVVEYTLYIMILIVIAHITEVRLFNLIRQRLTR